MKMNEPELTKKEYVKMLYDRAEYLKSEIADFEQCNGGVEQARLWAIKEQVSRIFGLIDVCDKELFPDTIRCEKTEQEYIQTCNTEQLADLMSRMVGCSNCPIPKDGRSCMGTYSGCWHEIIKWLKQQHKQKGD